MRALHVNLAARAYRDYKPVYLALTIIGVITAFLMVNNVMTAYDYFANTKSTRAKIDRLQENILDEQRRAETIDAQIRRIDFASMNEQITYVNSQIVERSFSWSRMLTDLERVVPPDVRLLALNPSISKEGGISLQLNAMSRKSNGLVEFLNRLIDDPRFARPLPRSEATSAQGLDFNLTVEYQPDQQEVRP